MKVKTGIFIGLVLLLCFVMPASAVTEINSSSSFPYTMNSAGETYILTEDISTSAGALVIGSNNITFDGQNHTVTFATATDGMGIYASGRSGITIKNTVVLTANASTSGTNALYMVSCTNPTVENCYSYSIATYSTRFATCTGVTAINSNFSAYSAYGLTVDGCTGVTLTNITTISELKQGTVIQASTGININGYTAESSNAVAMQISSNVSGSEIRNCTGTTNVGNNGILVYNGCTDNDFYDCIGESNTGSGIYINNAPGNTFTRCEGTGGTNGIILNTGSDNVILTDCIGESTSTLSTETYAGITTSGVLNITIENSVGISTSTSGMHFKTSTLNMSDSNATSDTGYGMYLSNNNDSNFENMYIFSDGNHGLNIAFGAKGNNFTGCTLESNTLKGVRISNSGNNTFTNCIINSPIASNQHTGKKMLIVGDSISEGYPNTQTGGWGSIIQSKIESNTTEDLHIINQANGGSVSGWGLVEFSQYMNVYDPDIVTIMYGVNDLNTGVQQAAIISNILSMADIADTSGAEVYILLTPAVDGAKPYADGIIPLDRELYNQSIANGYNVISMYDILDSDPLNGVYNDFDVAQYLDNVHLTSSANSLVGDRIFNVLFSSTSIYPISNKVYPDGMIVNTRFISVSDTPLPFVIVPSSNSVTIDIITWTSAQKIWTESSSVEQSVTHTIGDFPANTDIDIDRDGIDYDTVRSNSTGYITWVYDGGFSEHTFEAIPHATAGVRDSFVNSWGNTVSMVGAIIVIALAGSAIAVFRGKRDISDLVNDLPGIVLIVVMLVVGAIIFGQF